MIGCMACDLLEGRRSVPGGLVLDDDHWAAEHCVGAFGIGAFVAKTKEHRDSLWTMSDAEAASLGPSVRRLSGAIVEGMGAERVYITMWVDAPPHHLHLVLWPRYPGEERGSELEAMEDAARRVRGSLR